MKRSLLILPLAILGVSCVTVVNPGGTPPPSSTVKIRLINLSSKALDPQLFVSAQTLGDPATTLFLAENQLTQGIGFAGTGLIPGGQENANPIEIPCENANGIGIKGGVFKDATTGETLGTGQQRVIAIENGYSCGDTVTFTYLITADGYTTRYNVQ